MLRTGLSVLLLLGAASPTSADEAAATRAFVKAFASLCMLPAPEFQKVELTARIKGWEAIPSGKPAMPEAVATSWLVPDAASLPVVVSVTRVPNSQHTRTVAACTMQSRDVASATAQRDVTEILDLPAPKEETTDGDQHNTTWVIRYGPHIVTIVLTTETPAPKTSTAKPGLHISVLNENGYRRDPREP